MIHVGALPWNLKDSLIWIYLDHLDSQNGKPCHPLNLKAGEHPKSDWVGIVGIVIFWQNFLFVFGMPVHTSHVKEPPPIRKPSNSFAFCLMKTSGLKKIRVLSVWKQLA